MNCGKNARKNSATLGFNILVSTPDQKIFRPESWLRTSAISPARLALRIALAPKYTKYTAPKYFTILNASNDCESSTDSPNPAANV